MSPFEHYGEEKLGSCEKPDMKTKVIGTDFSYKHTIVWSNVTALSILHFLGLWGFHKIFTGGIQLRTVIWAVFLWIPSLEGITIGAHRLYSHRSFKASPLVRAGLIICQTIAGQYSMFTWCRDHRMHHRYSDTDADPHNPKRGFFFSHIGWLMVKKHPLVIELGKKIDLSDLQADWMVMFQRKHFLLLYFIFAIAIPVALPVYFFKEGLLEAFLVAYAARYICTLHQTWLVNSVAHRWGLRPYDKNLMPVESWFVSFVTLGEGWHNYHHTFPWDYRSSEFCVTFNTSSKIIEFLAKIGHVTDLKTVSDEMVNSRIKRTGDGSHWALGTEEGRRAVKALGPLYMLNPFTSTSLPAPKDTLDMRGLALYEHDDVDSNHVTVTGSFGQKSI